MGAIRDLASLTYADGPAGLPTQPRKDGPTGIRALFALIDSYLVGLSDGSIDVMGGWSAASGAFPGSGAADLGQAWLVTTAGTTGGVGFVRGDRIIALVDNPSTSTYASNWLRIPSGKAPLVRGTDAGAGTPNAIQITTDFDVDPAGGQFVTFQVFDTNTAVPVTVEINGVVYTIQTASGNNPAVGGLSAGLPVLGQIVGSTFIMTSDQTTAALLAAVEAAAQNAIDAAAIAIDVPQHLFTSKSLAEASPPLPGPPSVVLMTGFDAANDFRLAKPFVNLGASEPAEYLKAQINGNWYRIGELLEIEAADWGVKESNADNTTAYDRIVAGAPSGAKVLMPRRRTLAGHFLTADKVFDLDLNGSSLVDTVDNLPIVGQRYSAGTTSYNVVESVLTRGMTSFTIVGASGIFAAGDIGFLWDGAVRTTGGNVNFECVRIKSVVGDVVTVEGFIRSYKGAGAITFRRPNAQTNGGAIRNGRAIPTVDHVALIFGLWFTPKASQTDLEVVGSSGPAFDLRYCWEFDAARNRCFDPIATGSGEGYGMHLVGCSLGKVYDTIGRGCRHAFDADSSYGYHVDGVTETGAPSPSNPCTIAHNGFAADVTVTNVDVVCPGPAVAASAQGYGTSTGQARAENHPLHNLLIDGVRRTIPANVSPDTYNSCVDLGQDWSGDIRNIEDKFLSTDPVTAASQAVVVRLDGIPIGKASIENIHANKCGNHIFGNNRANGPAYGGHVLFVRNLSSDTDGRKAIWLRGDFALDADAIFLAGVIDSEIISMQSLNGDAPRYAAIGAAIRYTGTEKAIFSQSVAAGLEGAFLHNGKSLGGNVVVVAGQALTLAQVQNRRDLLQVNSPVGAGTCILSATDALPPCQINGQIMTIEVLPGRNDVQFPAGNGVLSTFTVATGTSRRVVAYSGKWRLLT